MEPQQIKSFIDAMASSDLAEMEFSQDGWTLRLVRRPVAGATQATTSTTGHTSATAPPRPLPKAAVATEAPRELQSPLFGVVHLQSAPGEAAFAATGQAVRAGQTLCVIEAMKVFNEVCAEHDAIVDAVLVKSGQEVEAGQALMRFR